MDTQDKSTDELRVEHVLAALEQITTLCTQVRKAMESMDPKTVLTRARAAMVPPQKMARCDEGPSTHEV